jgi:dynein heavy chain 1
MWQAQLQVQCLPAGSSVIEALHACVHSTLAPFFNAFVRANAKDQPSATAAAGAGLATSDLATSVASAADVSASVSASVAAVGAVKQKLDDLEVSLFNAKQNVQIETVVLDYHPVIKEAAEKARAAGRTLKADDLASRAADAEFLNQLQASVNGWIQKIERVTKLERIDAMPARGETMQEVSFWSEIEAEVAHIEEQLRSPEAATSQALLKQAKRFWATMAFDTDTIGLKKVADLAKQYAPLTSALPLTPLRQAVSVDALRVAVVDVFAHLQRAGTASTYPIERHLRLVEAVARDVAQRLVLLLSMRPLLTLDASEADAVAASVGDLFAAWREQFSEYHGMLRKLAKRRGQNKLAIHVNVDNKPLEERVAAVRRFRRQHEQLRSVIANALPADALDGRDATGEIAAAYAGVQRVDVLAELESTDSPFDAAVRAYDERVEYVDAAITAQLRERLATAQSANEMFRVCTKFNALFYRPRVRGAVREYQAQLIARVKDDIRALQETFKQQYLRTEASHVARLRDVPPVSGAIIWARQLERQLAGAMARVENVLGHGWELDVEGARLAADAERFRAKLNVDAMFEHWVKDTEARSLEVVGRVLDVRKRAGGQLALDIHFAEHLTTLFKEVRNLQWLGFRVPFSITQPADRAKVLYPFAVSLRESLRAYDTACSHIDAEPAAASLGLLVASFKRDVQALIADGFKLRWEAWSKLNPFVRKLGAAVQAFASKSEEAIARSRAVRTALDALSACDYDTAALRDALARIQAVIDELELAAFSNLPHWLAEIEARVVDVLEQRLVSALGCWNDVFGAAPSSGGAAANPPTAAAAAAAKKAPTAAEVAAAAAHDALRAKLKLRLTLHEIVIRNQQMTLEPPLEGARERWIDYLHSWLNVVCGQKRLRASRYNESLADGGDAASAATSTYRDVLGRIGGTALGAAFSAIEKRLREVGAYVDEWLRYQALWDLEPAVLYDRLGDDVERWRRVLVEIKKSRATFDNAATRREFGPITIDYAQVQQQVNTKYDYWHRDALSTFGTRLGGVMRGTHEDLAAARQALETLPLDVSSPAHAVAFIVALQRTKRQVKEWTARVESLNTGQQLLKRARYAFAVDWLDYAMVEGEWSALGELLRRKEAAVEAHVPVLQQRVRDDTATLESRVGAFVAEWPNNVANNPGAAAQDALVALAGAEGALKALHGEHERLTAAREALDLGAPSVDPRKRLEPVAEELEALRGVWNALGDVWRTLDQMGEQSWATIQPRKVRKELENVLEALKQMPSRVRQYDAFGFVQARVKELLKHNLIVTDLHSEALRERHWRDLRKRLGVNWVLSELTLGDIWRADLTKNGNKFRDIITQAQGELALEEFLKSVREHWQAHALELVPYQSKCMLIKGWDDLFSKLGEHLGSLSSMKMSPFFKVFEDDHAQWDDKLNRTRALFDVWIDVQRRWVYLESIFSGSGDIATLLPKETARFRSLNQEFLTLMRRVAKAPLVLEVLAIDGVQRAVEHLLETLLKVQKALGDYLERQRASFPRFYFIGDDDLLEIIGNSKDLDKTQKHLRKMFAGVASLTLADENARIVGMTSAEGESVALSAPIVLANVPKVHEWLTALEAAMRVTLARLMRQCHAEAAALDFATAEPCMAWIARWPAQLVQLSMQVLWTAAIEKALSAPKDAAAALDASLARTCALLDALAEAVMRDLPAVSRQKFEHLVTELVHQRDVTRTLRAGGVDTAQSFAWLTEMRYYYAPPAADAADAAFMKALQVRVANAQFDYGWEYLGVGERLVQTPLTSRAYLTLTQALHARMGGSPFGPAGTGKTETAKALGTQLGRYTLVFCCDDSFDLKAVSRIFVGLCMCGAWGVFDEFNRLEERILSAVSQQIQVIQEGLAAGKREIELGERTVPLSDDMGIFVTMNPGYAGRTELPQNLKQLFRGIAMISPDRELIAQVMLFSQGYKTAERLASKIVPLFRLCAEQLSSQAHYDFGLRALKSVLVSAGRLKRHTIMSAAAATAAAAKDASDAAAATAARAAEAVLSATGDRLVALEAQLLMRSVCETVLPKLVAGDIGLFHSLLGDVFPGVQYEQVALDQLLLNVRAVCAERQLLPSDAWIAKLVQLYQMVALHHGLMMVGPSAGKSAAWRVLLEALERTEGVRGASYVLDPKAITKDELFGTLDATTREWTDGLFTHLLRRIIDNVRGDEHLKRHWIVFDGDVDPEWVENLNALLDDNRILTLPNGERLALPNNVRIMFEVQHLKYATPATVSRCGMVFFSAETLPATTLLDGQLLRLRARPCDGDERAARERELKQAGVAAGAAAQHPTTLPGLHAQRVCADALAPHMAAGGFVLRAIEYAEQRAHIMTFTRLRVLESLFAILNMGIARIAEYNVAHGDFPLDAARTSAFIEQWLAFAVMWGVGGSMSLHERELFGRHVADLVPFATPDGSGSKGAASGAPSLLDYSVQLEHAGGWQPWTERVPRVDIETHQVGSPDLVIATVDTVRHEAVLRSWLHEHRPLLLCGPPGSGKSMTLQATLQSMPEIIFVSLNFSSATTPELLMNTFQQYCEYTKTATGDTVLRPTQANKWLVLFCDEINLPSEDRYGTQRVITFLRQLTEHGGFWRAGDHVWVTLERVQFVGACNPPTDPGRVAMTTRFLRHAPLLLVDFPSRASLTQIYGTFSRALLKLVPPLRAHAGALTDAMVDVYSESAVKFTPDVQPHYIYSPRELTRWVRALHTAIVPLDGQCSLDGLVRLWAHEGLRLFSDRLVTRGERQWTDALLDRVAARHFGDAVAAPGGAALQRPIMFSKWLTSRYESVQIDKLREYVQARLKVFYEEELDVPVVLFDEVLEHILRLDRVFRQSQGHALLVGVSGGGKTLLSRFVAWLGGLSVFTIKVNNRYTAEDFDEDLRSVMKRAGCNDEKICFIFDESNVLSSAFLERMNTLLAGGEVPGLFEGEEYTSLMHQCKDAANRAGQLIDGDEELYRFFVAQVRRNLHIVFTMNPASTDFHNRSATSPALYNRCVIDWFGDWPDKAFQQVASEFTHTLDIDDAAYEAPLDFPVAPLLLTMPARVSHRDAVIASLVYVHSTITEANARLQRTQGRTNYVTPRHFLDFIAQFVKMLNEKRAALEEEQLHLNVGLRRLTDTAAEVQALQKQLATQNRELQAKNVEANEKLKQMVADQQVAEEKRRASVALQAQLDERNVEIQKQKASAYADLEKAEPALISAQQAVSAIQKKHLDEIKALPKPPEKIRLTLEAVAMLLEGKPVKFDWADIRRIVSGADFTTRVEQFDSKTISKPVRAMVMKEYTSLPDFTAERINTASRACGPLAEWVIAQVFYSDILDRVAPLRQQVESLEAAAKTLVEQQRELQATVKALETSIARYKDEYAALISETERIKTTMADVERRVTRSVSLLDNLGSERDRWRAQSTSFQAELATMVGDVLVCSAFLAYAGFFDQQYRDGLLAKWTARLRAGRLALKENLSVSTYLSTPEDRMGWHANALPADELSTENAVMLQRFNRYPLVIDPSGQAAEFLLKQYASRRIAKTSFLDASFMKNLESALRFGTPLLVQDVENIDPVVNPVLNKEIYKKGGRVLIRLGDQDIDFSPTFVIFLVTRDPTAHFTPDLCSRVTFVNFTVTPAGLLSQLAHETLRVERPDVHERRTDVLRLQGEYRVRLRALEKSLLTALNEAEGNLLDNDTVLATLERLKHDAADVARKAADADAVMTELTATSRQYAPFAKACSAIYFALEELAQVHFLYQFSLPFFFDLFNDLLAGRVSADGMDARAGAPKLLDGVAEHAARLQRLGHALFRVAFRRVSRSLLHGDYVTFGVRLVQIALQLDNVSLPADEFEFLLRGGEAASADDQSPLRLVDELARIADWKELGARVRSGALEPYRKSPSTDAVSELPADAVPATGGGGSSGGVVRAFRNVLLAKTLRSDRVPAALEAFVEAVFEKGFLAPGDADLAGAAQRVGAQRAPLLLAAAPGFDAGVAVEAMAQRLGKKCTSLAIGSPEGFGLAETALGAASSGGTWLLLKNVHLAPAWLVTIEKRLHTLTPHADFRLFLTAEMSELLPRSLLRLAQVFVFEKPPGLKASLQLTFGAVAARANKAPVERSRLYFMVHWFHAVVLERLRYAPLGWSKAFEFGESDLNGALNTLDEWLEAEARGKSNVAPERVPWAALRSLLGQSIYGGRLDNTFDQRLLDALLEKLFTPRCFDAEFALVDVPGLRITAPEGTKAEAFQQWIDALPSAQSPAWLGLPADAERLLLTNNGRRVLRNLLKMYRVDTDSATEETEKTAAAAAAAAAAKADDARPAWMTALEATVTAFAAALPAKFEHKIDAGDNVVDPLQRFFAREVATARQLLASLRADLRDLAGVCKGDVKQTNHLRALIASITKGTVPAAWRQYEVPPSVGCTRWISDFAARLRQFDGLSFRSVTVGALMQPSAYITATRQAAAKARGWSLENLVLDATVLDGAAPAPTDDPTAFVVRGLYLVAATWRDGALRDGGDMLTALPAVMFRWRDASSTSSSSTADTAAKAAASRASLPLYTNDSRRTQLLVVDLPAQPGVPSSRWAECGTALLAANFD